MKPTPGKARAGFSLIELVVTMTILAILVGVVSFRSGSVVEKGKVTKVLSLIGALKSACALHHADTGSYAYEYTGYDAPNRKLSADQTDSGWSGPYIDAPLTDGGSNPFGGLHVYKTATGAGCPGFDTDGDGVIDVGDSANMLYLSGVDEKTAKMIDSAFDEGLNGDWYDSGKVRWHSTWNRCWVLIYR